MRKAEVTYRNTKIVFTRRGCLLFLAMLAAGSVVAAGVLCAKMDRRLMLLSTTIAEADRPVGKSENKERWQSVQMRVTAYCPCERCCGVYADGVTACNHKIEDGDRFAAADSRYPFGTEMVIPGYNSGRSVKVLDRGGVITGNKLDVFFHSHEEALEWGVKHLEVKVRI